MLQERRKQVPSPDPVAGRLGPALPVASDLSTGQAVVLVVEDNLIMQRALAEFLRMRGYSFVLAHDGQDALVKVKFQKVDLLTMDIDMPVMDGIEATRRIRALGGWWSRVPIIGFSSRDDAFDHVCCRDAGMNVLVSKGDGLHTLFDTIQRFIRINDRADPAPRQAVQGPA